MNVSRLTKSTRRFAASAAILAALGLSAAYSSEPQPVPVPSLAPTPAPTATAEQAADAAGSDALRASFNATNKSASWADKVTSIRLDGSAVIVISTFTKVDKAMTRTVCEAAYKAAKESKVDFLGVAVRSADDSTLAHRNDKYGPANCEN